MSRHFSRISNKLMVKFKEYWSNIFSDTIYFIFTLITRSKQTLFERTMDLELLSPAHRLKTLSPTLIRWTFCWMRPKIEHKGYGSDSKAASIETAKWPLSRRKRDLKNPHVIFLSCLPSLLSLAFGWLCLRISLDQEKSCQYIYTGRPASYIREWHLLCIGCHCGSTPSLLARDLDLSEN